MVVLSVFPYSSALFGLVIQWSLFNTNDHGNLRYPPKATPPINKALLRDYENPLVSLNKAGYFLGVNVALGGGTLGSHEMKIWDTLSGNDHLSTFELMIFPTSHLVGYVMIVPWRVRPSKRTPTDPESRIPQASPKSPPNERNSYTNCCLGVWGMLQCSRGMLENS